MLRLTERQGTQDFVVTDEKGSYAGLVTAGDLKAALVYREAIPLLQVNELQRSNLPVIEVDEPLDLVLEKFSQCDADSLAVLDHSHQHATGMVTRSQLMRRYQTALDRDE
jgi:predicted transcriptional regulator